jgi:hypothetical protein
LWTHRRQVQSDCNVLYVFNIKYEKNTERERHTHKEHTLKLHISILHAFRVIFTYCITS